MTILTQETHITFDVRAVIQGDSVDVENMITLIRIFLRSILPLMLAVQSVAMMITSTAQYISDTLNGPSVVPWNTLWLFMLVAPVLVVIVIKAVVSSLRK